jgi:serine/threonine-protein kinase RsbW
MPTHSHQPASSATLLIPNRRDEIDRAEVTILTALEDQGYTESSRFAVRLALEEALSNAFHHGHRHLPESTPVRLEYSIDPTEVRIAIEDQGPGFKPDAVPDPTLDENLELPSGRGLLLIRAYMASVEYSPRGNRVSMVFRPAKPGPDKQCP